MEKSESNSGDHPHDGTDERRIICLTEVVRVARYLNVLIGLTIASLPWFLSGSTTGARINDLLVGLIVAALAIPFGPKTERYGMWEKWVR